MGLRFTARIAQYGPHMKFHTLLAGLLLMAGASRSDAVPYTDVYDIFQGGYDGGDFTGTMSATVNITDMDGDGLISTRDTIVGSLIFRRSIGNGRTYVRGFEITGIIGSSLLSGPFSIAGLSHLGGPATITNAGGTVVNFDFPFTGQFSVASTTQVPVVTKRVPDGGPTALLFGLGVLGLCRLKLSVPGSIAWS